MFWFCNHEYLHIANCDNYKYAIGISYYPFLWYLLQSFWKSLITAKYWWNLWPELNFVHPFQKYSTSKFSILSECCQDVVVMLSFSCHYLVVILSRCYQDVIKILSECCHCQKLYSNSWQLFLTIFTRNIQLPPGSTCIYQNNVS